MGIFMFLVFVSSQSFDSEGRLEILTQSAVCVEKPAPKVSCVWQGRYQFQRPMSNTTTEYSILLAGFRGNPQFELNGELLQFTHPHQLDQNFKTGAPIQVRIPQSSLSTLNVLNVSIASNAIMGPHPGDLMVLETSKAEVVSANLTTMATDVVDLANGLLFGLALLAIFMAFVSSQSTVYVIFSISAISIVAASGFRSLIEVGSDSTITVFNYLLTVSGSLLGPLILSAWRIKISPWFWSISAFIPMTIYVLIFTIDDQNAVYIATIVAWLANITLAGYALLRLLLYRLPISPLGRFWLSLVVGPALYIGWILTAGQAQDQTHAPLDNSVYLCIIIFMSGLLGFRFILDFVDLSTHEQALSVAVRETKTDVIKQQLIIQKQQVMIAAEKERNRIMAGLHDGTAGFLLGITAVAKQRSNDPAVSKILGLATDGLNDLRLTVDSLEETAASLQGCLNLFRSRVESLLEYSSLTLVWIEEPHEKDLLLDPNTALNLTRILQEIINNAMRHSDGDQIRVEISYSAKTASKIQISDNGINAPTNVDAVSHAGIRNMRHRAEMIGGALTFGITSSGGMKVTLEFTCQSENLIDTHQP